MSTKPPATAQNQTNAPAAAPRADEPAPRDAAQTAPEPKREVRVEIEPPAPPPDLRSQGARRIVGRPLTRPPPDAAGPPPPAPPPDDAGPAPDSLRELAYLDRINESGEAQFEPPADRLPRLYDADYAILALLDRAGLVPRTLIARAVLPDRAPSAVAERLTKLSRAGLTARHSTGLRQRERSDGKPPLLHSLTRHGLQVAQARHPAPAISKRREWRPLEQFRAARLGHDLHALAWAIALHRTVGTLATDNWRTPRYATGRFPVPQVGSGQRRPPITLNEIPVPDGQAIIDVAQKPFSEIKPDLALELRIDTLNLTFDVLVELDLTGRPT